MFLLSSVAGNIPAKPIVTRSQFQTWGWRNLRHTTCLWCTLATLYMRIHQTRFVAHTTLVTWSVTFPMGSMGKPLASCKNFYSFPIESNLRIAAIQICETVKIIKMIHLFSHMDVMYVIFIVCFTEKSLYFMLKHKKETYFQNNT